MSETISCPLCKTSESTPVIHDNGFTGRQCARCGLIFISPRPSEQEMEELYHEGDAYLPPEFFLATSKSLTGRLSARSAVHDVTRHVPQGSLLEIGPGNGGFLEEARRRGFDVSGVELNEVQAEFIRVHRGIRCVSSLAAATELAPFDVIYHRDVVSHFYNPIEEFTRLHGLLRPGGYHIFETGNFGDVDHRHFAHVKSFQYPDHLFFYSERSMVELLGLTGFEHIHTSRYSTRPEQILRTGVRRVLSTVKGGAKGDAGADDHAKRSPAAQAPSAQVPPGRAGILARDLLDMTYYGIRHTLGRATIRSGDPQALTVVARAMG